MSETPGVEVQVTSVAGSLPETGAVERWVQVTLAAADYHGGATTTVRIVDDEEIQALNRDYRDKDKATNVLSFPAETIEGLPEELHTELGDIVICAPVVAREADEQGKAPADHWAHMLVHGTLHLLGYDHIEEHDAEAMEALERRILGQAGIADPYGASG
ncbi:MAG: rRNA maturation RNase YbeY [Pseudomonadota bacterium]